MHLIFPGIINDLTGGWRPVAVQGCNGARVNERDRAWSSVVERVERGVAAASVVRAWYERGYLGTARARIRVFERGDIV